MDGNDENSTSININNNDNNGNDSPTKGSVAPASPIDTSHLAPPSGVNSQSSNTHPTSPNNPRISTSSLPDKGPHSPKDGAGTPSRLSIASRVSSVASQLNAMIHNSKTNLMTVDFPPSPENVKKNKHANYLRTTKYTLLTFLPLNLLFQFRRFYNLYFLAGALSTLSGQASLSASTQITPLVLVLAVTAIKDAVEDYSRYRADREANNRPHTILRNGKRIEIKSMRIQPGDILYIKRGEKIPADCMLISTDYDDGSCFIETADLDGETNLKRKAGLLEMAQMNTDESVTGLLGKIECEQPNDNLNAFFGRVTFQNSTDTRPLNMNQFLPRGAVLRNTAFAYAVVIYSGKNTKIMKNLRQSKLKFSTLESRLNKLILGIFIYNIFLIVSSVLFEFNAWKYLAQEAIWFFVEPEFASQESTAEHVGFTLLSFFVLYTYVIPISLFVTMEVVRFLQGLWMSWDLEMMSKREKPGSQTEFENVPMKASNTNLNEDLGRVDYVFSDKTGTITQNVMKLSNWYVNSEVYDEMANPGALRTAYEQSSGKNGSSSSSKGSVGSSAELVLFLRALGLCHSAIPAHDEKTNEIIFESQSPDEIALLKGARQNGVEFVLRKKTTSKLVFWGHEEEYAVLKTLEFTSDRKRMSVIVRTPDNQLHLYCKGADNIIFERLERQSVKVNEASKLAATESALEAFAVQGLRTLVIAYRTLTEAEYEAFLTEYDEAEQAIEHRDDKIAAVCEKIEKGLVLLGSTAIEDKLQDEVPETIEFLLQCGIKVWVLTGDKRETAINIGMSSRVISAETRLCVIDEEDPKSVKTRIKTILKEMEEFPDRLYGLVVTGLSLGMIFDLKKEKEFLEIGKRCRSVICCRVTPLQKALVVKLVQDNVKTVTLAIGDGANDVTMIQAANIGVGIVGREGSQASRAADYAFGEFRFLKRLLAVHGRYSYLRFSKLIYYSFYKNLALISVQWIFGFFNMWSASLVYEEIFLTLYNVIYTSLPPVVLACFERDVSPQKLYQYPQLYREVKDNIYWNWKRFGAWIGSSALHAVLVFFLSAATVGEGSLTSTGRTSGYFVQNYFFSTAILLTVLLRFGIVTKYWVHLTWIAITVCIVLHIITMFALQGLPSLTVESDTVDILYVLPNYYLTSILIPVVCCIPDFTFMSLKRMFFPCDLDIIAEEEYVEKLEAAKKQKEEAKGAKDTNANANADVEMVQVA